MQDKRSKELFSKAKRIIPGGVNSPVRACKAVGLEPLFISQASDAYIWDEDGNRYIDYVCSWGPLILGHTHPEVIEAINRVSKRGISYGAPTSLEVEMAELIADMIPSVEMVRMVNSGTEATMSAIRLARGYTKRSRILKFEGCYHGHVDSLMVSAGSGLATFGIPSCPGIPEELAGLTIIAPYNDIERVEQIFKEMGEEIACVIVEPVAGNMGVVLPKEGFLEGLRDITKRYGALLIFDEVITGFRISPGGAQEFFNIKPDLTCLGKIIGGGMPVGAYGGKREIMQGIAPMGDIYQAGTLSGNPVTMAAGIATLKILKDSDIYQELNTKAKMLFEGVKKGAERYNIDITVNYIASMGTIFFKRGVVENFDDATSCDEELFKRFYSELRSRGIYIPPSPYEAWFISLAHSIEDIEKTIYEIEDAFRSMS